MPPDLPREARPPRPRAVKCAVNRTRLSSPRRAGCRDSRSGRMIRIGGAIDTDLVALGRLFDEYRQFYKLPGDLEKSTRYRSARLSAGESIVLVAVDDGD